MGKIFYIMGKSASGKDKIYGLLAENKELALKKIVLYTTRPIRRSETDGVEYHFVDEAALAAFAAQGKVIEQRDYHTVMGIWSYATIDDGSVRLDAAPAQDGDSSGRGEPGGNYIAIGTLESYRKIRDYYGEDAVCPVYIEVEDGERLARALKREKKQAEPKYLELCRRFLADSEDFSEENIRAAGITRRFDNTGELDECLKEVEEMIRSML
ncbi:MAG: guanylate kinase [Lachnospiraceae bacterium]|nr:guanylate kinase [Lachnospiraceae bacterium]